MKVNSKTPNPATIAGLNTRGPEKSKNKGPEGAVTPQDIASSAKVNMSTQAQQIKKATAIAKEESIDEAKVARLQKLIDEGKYRVDAEAVADRLIDEHLRMGE